MSNINNNSVYFHIVYQTLETKTKIFFCLHYSRVVNHGSDGDMYYDNISKILARMSKLSCTKLEYNRTCKENITFVQYNVMHVLRAAP